MYRKRSVLGAYQEKFIIAESIRLPVIERPHDKMVVRLKIVVTNSD